MKPCCYVAGCRNPIKSKNTMACLEHAQHACPICKRQVPLVRDHDHTCHPATICIKCFRGFLCPTCNSGLGMFQDDPQLLRAAAAYLEAPRVAVVRVPPERKVWPGSQKSRFVRSTAAKITAEEIEAGRSAAGGWTRAQLAAWGVPWPPPKGWLRQLLEDAES